MEDISRKYKLLELNSATDLEAVVILYDEAIFQLKIAQESYLKDKNCPDFKKNIEFAQKILKGLSLILDFERGGDIAFNLFRLYEYMDKRLLIAKEGIHLTLPYLEEVIGLLSKLKDSWVIVAKKEKEANSKQIGSQDSKPGHIELTI